MKEFHTFREYMNAENKALTASMEDYLEMIYRLSETNGYTRIHELAAALHVQPPAATKMVQKLSENGLVLYEKYGMIQLKERGETVGKALLSRHNIVQTFLSILGIEEDSLLKETEKIEHTLSEDTLSHIARFLAFFQSHPEIEHAFRTYCSHEN